MDYDPKTTRELINCENEMINQRMSWFLILQGFMLAGLAFAWEKSVALCVVFSFIGILSSLSVGILLRYGILAIKHLEESCQDPENKVLGRGYKETPILLHILLPWNFLPLLFMIAWVALIFVRCFEGA